MAVLSDIAEVHKDTAIAKAAETGHPPLDIARTTLTFASNKRRDIGDMPALADELNTVTDNLDPYREYTFMRA